MSIRARHSAFHRRRLEEAGITQPNLPDDVLASKQFQTLVELLGEGEIEGFPSATGSKGSAEYNQSSLKDVFLDGTQVLQQSAGTSPIGTDFNFQNVSFEPRFGTSSQTPIQGISEIETENAVGVAVTKASPVSRSITNTSVNAVRVTLGFPSLQKLL
jgi:predicted phage tail protein